MARQVLLKGSDTPVITPVTFAAKTATTEKQPRFKRLMAWLTRTFTSPRFWIMGGGLLCLIAVLSVLIYYVIVTTGLGSSSVRIDPYLPFAVSKIEQESLPELTMAAPRIKENPINGVKYTVKEYNDFAQKPMIAVMIENQVSARPQAGYSQADLVYEALAEGGITRTMAIFWSQSAQVKQIGPIRSARNYFLQLVNPFDALYMHIGCAASTNPQVNACGNRYTYNIKTMDTAGTFFRVNHKLAPHNAYTTPTMLYDVAMNRKWDAPPDTRAITVWQFKNDPLPADRGDNKGVHIQFYQQLSNNGLYDVEWKYNQEQNLYYRYNGGQVVKDENNGVAVSAKTVIIERSEMYFANDGLGRLIFKVIGTGTATILQDGHAIDATWEKKDRTSRTVYYDAKTKEQLKFNRGQIWVTIVPQQYGKITLVN